MRLNQISSVFWIVFRIAIAFAMHQAGIGFGAVMDRAEQWFDDHPAEVQRVVHYEYKVPGIHRGAASASISQFR